MPTITGELRRYFRDRTWTIRPPRDVQELYLKVNRTRALLSQELGREPTVGDVADRLGSTPEAVVDALAAGDAHSPVSLDCPHGDDRSEGSALIDLVADPAATSMAARTPSRCGSSARSSPIANAR